MAEEKRPSSEDEPTFEPEQDDLTGETFEQPLATHTGSAPDAEAFDEPQFESETGKEPVFDPMAPPQVPTDDDEYDWFGGGRQADTSAKGPRHLGRTGPFWIIAGGIVTILIILIWVAVAGRQPEETAFELTDAPATGLSGGITVESELPPSPTPSPEPTPIPALIVGQTVLVANTDGDGIRLRGEPSLGSVTLEIFTDGDEFVVLDPGSEFQAYPVESDGYGWYRIRSASGENSGLVGWAAGDFLAPASE